MRLEQLVLFGPSDNFRVQFGPRVTVLAGLENTERSSMIETLVSAMAGRLPNASVIFVDETGRRVYADRSGATYADNGVAAPSLSELLGSDPSVVSGLVTLRAEDLGLGEHRSDESVAEELEQARASLAQTAAEHAEATTLVVQITNWEDEVARLDDEIERIPDEQARWEWMQLRNQLDALRAELASIDRSTDDDDGGADVRLLAAVEELRSVGESWAEASATATELSQKLGPLPPVSEADMARVAATPEHLPEDFDDRIEALEAAIDLRAASEAIVAAASAPADDPGDGIVFELAKLDQDALWECHGKAVRAQAAYDAELAARDDEVDPELESEIEAAHRGVVTCQRKVDERFRPGLLGVITTAAGAVLAAVAVSMLVAIAMTAAAGALGIWLLVAPRRALADAIREEDMALAHSDADSWLGIHLLRIDDVMQPSDRTGLNAALDLCTSTRLDWEQFSGGVSLKAAGEREDAIRRYAAATDPRERAARERVALDGLAQATQEEAIVRRALTAGLEGYGLSDEGTADLTPEQIRGVLEQRTAAGRFAREALELQHQLATATSSGALLDRLLKDLGFGDGDLAGRLERAIVSVEAARRRRMLSADTRTRDELEAEIERLEAQVDQQRRMTWDLTPDPTEAPPAIADVLELRRALMAKIGEQRKPNLADQDRRLAVATDRVRSLEEERSAIAEGPTSVRRRLADRIARTGWIGPNEETLPLLIDDALVGVEPSELFKLLDMVVRLSDRTQIVLLSSDPTIAKWARREAEHGIITLFEADGVAVR